MPEGSLDLFGRDGILSDLIPECLGYPHRRGRNRDLPVIVLLGPRGSGKTERLKRLEGDHAGVVPCVRLDLGDEAFADSPPGSPLRKVLIRLMFQLSERCAHFGRLKFPRLTLGLLAVDSPVDLNNRDRALSDIKNLLDNDERVKEVMDFIHELPEVVHKQQVVPVPAGTDTVLNVALQGLAPMVLRRVVLRKALSWYGQRVPGRSENPYDALIKLNHKNRRGAEERREVDETLFEAFLTDLQANFNEGFGHWDRVANCLALLDNVDSPIGESFLNLFVRARDQRARETTKKQCDPLVAVAARRNRSRRYDEGAVRADRPEDAGYHVWLAERSQERSSWLYLVELRDLTLQEVEQAVQEADLPRTPKGLARFTHRLTQGHPATVRLVIDSVKEWLQRDPSGLDLRKILDLPVRTNGSEFESSVGSLALDGLLMSMDATQRKDLVTFAAADDIVSAASLETLGVVTSGIVAKLYEILHADLWVTGTTMSGRQELVSHALLRRLLLWELAHRPEAAPDGWTAVQTWLRDYHEGPDDDVQKLRHTLALGDLDSVVRYFDGSFREGSIAEWLTEWHAVTAAPNRLQSRPELRDCSPSEQVKGLTADVAGGNPRGETIARLIAAKWILSDPLTVPDEELVSLTITELNHLAHLAGRDFKVLFDEGQRHRELMETWRL